MARFARVSPDVLPRTKLRRAAAAVGVLVAVLAVAATFGATGLASSIGAAQDQYGRDVTVTTNTWTLDQIWFNPCTNEDVHVIGEARQRTLIVSGVPTPTSSDDFFHWAVHTKVSASGTGVTTGDEYQVVETAALIETYTRPPNFDYPRIATVHDQVALVSRGAAENAVFSFELHLVNTPDGSQRVFAQEIETTCR